MSDILDSLLHPRVLTHCRQLYDDGHFKHAALEAMTQVELALKEKSGVDGKYGVSLVTSLFGNGKGIKLRVPFGDAMQEHAEACFKGAFAYYRNYCAHDGHKVDDQICIRILVLASELLDLVGASRISFRDVGGIAGLIRVGTFGSKESVVDLLHQLDGATLPDDDLGWLEDSLLGRGFSFDQVMALVDTGLVEYESHEYLVPFEMLAERDSLPATVGQFHLTELGCSIACRA